MANNEITRGAAQAALDTYALAIGDPGDEETLLGDLLADLHHVADKNGIDWYAAEGQAQEHYTYEVNHPEESLQ
jgi:hypothetical protein